MIPVGVFCPPGFSCPYAADLWPSLALRRIGGWLFQSGRLFFYLKPFYAMQVTEDMLSFTFSFSTVVLCLLLVLSAIDFMPGFDDHLCV